jgi:hypothetical protein
LILLITALAVYRITRLVVEDSILDTPRDWLIAKDWTAIECYWCVSFWIGLAATLVLYATEAAALPGVAWMGLPFAFSAIAGLLSSWE